MRLSGLVGTRYKEHPAEATLASHAFLLRGGYARQVANGIYSLLPAGWRVARKVKDIVREELERIGGQEVLLPLVQPRELWEASGRYAELGPELISFADRTGHDMVLAMTHEEAAVELCRGEVSSYQQLPFMIYQFQTTFRDVPRSRGGLLRVREFTMNDAYSFHASLDDLRAYYEEWIKVYQRVFARVGLEDVAPVPSDEGIMGGLISHEFVLLSDAGEDQVALCDTCSYGAGLDVAKGRVESYEEAPLPLEKVHTPGTKSIDALAGFLDVEPSRTAKVCFYDRDKDGKLVVVLIRGDLEVNEVGLARLIQIHPAPASEERIRGAGAVPGFATPIGLDHAACRILVDESVATSNNLVCGANEVDHHLKNFNLARDLPNANTHNLAKVRDLDRCPICDGLLHVRRGIQLGSVFQLGKKYTSAMQMTFTDETGATRVPAMGCYGIGIGRLVSSIMEVHHDEHGPKWPISVAPWQVHLCAIKREAPGVRGAADALYAGLEERGVEVIYDDRDLRAGVQFAEADLLGAPFRVTVGERHLKNGEVEWKRRDTDEAGRLPLDEAVETVSGWVAEALKQAKAVDDPWGPWDTRGRGRARYSADTGTLISRE